MTYTDITSLTERERAIEDKSALLAATLDNMDQGMIVLDSGLRIRSWNGRVVELLNLPDDCLRAGMPAADLIRYLGRRMGQTPEESSARSKPASRNFAAASSACLGGRDARRPGHRAAQPADARWRRGRYL